ncbi:tubulin-specific chaperone C [Brachionus plicatilis]|uniref:Tubulin-specific chaperone C n=1 Tax=Brachionus plicatilis TaxID=10195 RepID=A0A3M7SIJ6_BRAPC|nr:tubulin-specific chaperone C [Brachionus plicatilis]
MDVDLFQKQFYSEYKEIFEALSTLTKRIQNQEEKVEISSDYGQLNSRIEILQKYFTENSSFIPLYQVRKAQEHVGQLSRLAQEVRDEIFPKKKFGFKSKQKMTTLESAIQKAETQNVKEEKKSESLIFDNSNSCMIKSIRDQSYTKLEDEVNGKDIAIVDCQNSVIQIMGNPSVVQMSNVDSCTILCGPLSGSAFVNNVKNSDIVISSHQLRIHDSTDTRFYIHVGSRAIIENCKQLKFAPYAWSYPKLATHFDQSKLSLKSIGDFNWTAVDDFYWLNQQKQSPNWSFMPEDERRKWNSDQNGNLE